MTEKHISFDALTSKKTKPRRRGRKKDDAVLKGHEDAVDQLIEAKHEMDDWKVQLEEIRDELQPAAAALRKIVAEHGLFTKRVILQGTNQTIQLSYGDGFSKMDIRVKPELDKYLGPFSEQLFEVAEEAAVVPSKLDELRAILQAAGHDPVEFLDQEKFVRPVENFREKRFELRSQMSDVQNAAVDLVTDQKAHSPTLTVPKK